MDKTTQNLGIQIANLSIANAQLEAQLSDSQERISVLEKQLEQKGQEVESDD